MDLLKLLPILFVAAQGEGRALPHSHPLLPAIPGYVPVYIQQGPDVEVVYETARKVAIGEGVGSPLPQPQAEAQQPQEAQAEAQPQAQPQEVQAKPQEADKQTESADKKPELPAAIEPSSLSPAEPDAVQQSSPASPPTAATSSHSERQDHHHLPMRAASGAVGSVQEVPGYQVKEDK